MGFEDRIADLVLGPHLTATAGLIGNDIPVRFVGVIKTFEDRCALTLHDALEIFIVLISEGTQSDGGTMLFIDYSKGKSLGALDIPRTEALQTEIYHQTFKVMGDELGRRYSNNLIKRDELIDLLRRSKTALEEVPGNNLGIIYGAFIDSYGVDADNVFLDLVKAAGYKQIPTVYVMTPPKEVRNGDGAPKEPITPPKTSKKKR
ncbi:MAG: hypothetical protein HZB33_09100 [Nitrospirae bacterium]|nr:hypothetical protein [Nitrospirota bacterium]